MTLPPPLPSLLPLTTCSGDKITAVVVVVVVVIVVVVVVALLVVADHTIFSCHQLMLF